MRTEIRRIIRVTEDGELYTGRRRPERRATNFYMLETLRLVNGYVPKSGTYRVIFRLDPRGKLRLSSSCGLLKYDSENGYAVCFLPKSWRGKRISRTVEVL